MFAAGCRARAGRYRACSGTSTRRGSRWIPSMKRLEQEQSEFKDFLDRLRFAKDKTEFDQFMAERRNRPAEPKDVTPQQN